MLKGCCLGGAGSHLQGVILYHSQLNTNQAFVEAAELTAGMEKVQLRQNLPDNALDTSKCFQWPRHYCSSCFLI